jgi:phage N-6-adenine-methyltransferase
MLLGKNKPFDETKDEQYTPKWLFDKLQVTFDLDVAACETHFNNVPAKNYITKKENGLAQTWTGFVWMNPPYSKAKPWVEKFIQHGNGIALLPVSKSRWGIDMWNKSSAICLIYPIKFERSDGITKNIFMPVALFAMGQYAESVIRNAEIHKVR